MEEAREKRLQVRPRNAIIAKLTVQNDQRMRARLTPQVTGISEEGAVGVMDLLHDKLLKQGTPRSHKTPRRRAEAPPTPSIDSFDFGDFGMPSLGADTTVDQMATLARGMLGQLSELSRTESPASPSPTPGQGFTSPPALTLRHEITAEAEDEEAGDLEMVREEDEAEDDKVESITVAQTEAKEDDAVERTKDTL